MLVSVAETIRSALRLSFGRFGAIAGATVAPLVIGWGVLFASLNSYLLQLETFLRTPNAQVGSLALGLIAAGFFVALFLHAVMMTSATEVALGIERRGWRFFRADHTAWRLYAAYLRVLLMGAGVVGLVMLAVWLGHRLGGASYEIWFSANALGAFAFVFIGIRFVFLLAPVALMEHGSILRRALALSQGIAFRIFVIGLVLAIPGVLVQLGGEALLRSLGFLPQVRMGASFGELVELLRGGLPELLAVSSVAYFVSVVLLAGASASVYRAAGGISATTN